VRFCQCVADLHLPLPGSRVKDRRSIFSVGHGSDSPERLGLDDDEQVLLGRPIGSFHLRDATCAVEVARGASRGVTPNQKPRWLGRSFPAEFGFSALDEGRAGLDSVGVSADPGGVILFGSVSLLQIHEFDAIC
jgi:hypothetical protein